MTQGIEDVAKRAEVNTSALTDKPLKWHKFLIYFSLFIGALYAVSQGLGLLSGSIYTTQGITPSSFYTLFPNAKAVDILFGILHVALAIYMLVVRHRLSRKLEGAPNGLTVLYVCQIMSNVLYRLLFSAAVKAPVSLFLDMELAVNLIVGVLFIIVNRIYYRKRSHLFVF